MELVAEAIEEYALLHSSREDPLLAELAQETREGVPYAQMLTGHVEGSLLRLLVQLIGAKRVLEFGCYTGYSALSMAMGLPDDGRVITLDVSEVFTEVAKRYWARSPYGHKIELRLGPALDSVQTVDGPVDLVFIDADKENYLRYYEAAMPKLRQGGLIVADNVLWDGKVLDPKEQSDKAIVAFNQHVRYDSRVDALMLTIRDGVTVARKR